MAEKGIKKILLGERDLIILEFVGKFGVVREDHLMRLIGIAEKSVSNYIRIARRLTLANYLEKHKVFVGYGYMTLAAKSEELLGITRQKKLVLNTLRHDMLVLDVYFDLKDKNSNYQITSERELKIASGQTVGDKKKVPDLLVNENIAVEVELTEKSNSRLIAIISNYVHSNLYKEVWYFVKNKTLGNKIWELSGRNSKFKVFLLDLSNDKLSYSNLIKVVDAEVAKASEKATAFDLDQYLVSAVPNREQM